MQQVQIEQIRFDLTWSIRHEVMYPDLSFDAIKLDNDVNGIHFGLYANDQQSRSNGIDFVIMELQLNN